jgi:hypothetical protein
VKLLIKYLAYFGSFDHDLLRNRYFLAKIRSCLVSCMTLTAFLNKQRSAEPFRIQTASLEEFVLLSLRSMPGFEFETPAVKHIIVFK